MSKFNKKMSYSRALEKSMRYCSFQERCQLDLTNRFIAWNVDKFDWDNILDHLVEENYLNEIRYVESFIRGKFMLKKWGRNKIKAGLIKKRLYNDSFDKVFKSEIADDVYVETIKDLIEKKEMFIAEQDLAKKRDKIYRYMLSKGYESELVSKELNFIE